VGTKRQGLDYVVGVSANVCGAKGLSLS